MTDKLAILILTGIRESTNRLAAEQGYPEGSKLTVECFDAAIKALGYRDAQPVDKDGRYNWCPTCQSMVDADEDNYCTFCGQALKWED